MDQRRRIHRAGLLSILLLVVFLPALSRNPGLWAQEGEYSGEGILGGLIPVEETPRPPEVRAETSPSNPMVNNPWTVAILVNHPRSSEINVKPPRFPTAIILERVRTEARTIQGERWTRVEFLFTPQRAGAVTLQPFEVTVQGRKAETSEITVRFREEARTVRRYEPRFRWAAPLPSIAAGERGELFLELTNWDPSKTPPRGFLWGRAPRNAILEEGEAAATGEGSFRYPVFLIPLEGTEVILEALSFQAEGFSLNVPEIKLTVTAKQQDDPGIPEGVQARTEASQLPSLNENSGDENNQDEIHEADIPDDFFPENFAALAPLSINPETVFPLFRGEYKRISAGVLALWENNQHAQALAEIRRNERDSFLGPFLIPLRKEMEQALNLGFTGNERWQPLKISFVSWVILIILIVSVSSILLVFRPYQWIRFRKIPSDKVPEKSVTSNRRSGFKTIIILVVLAGIAVILVEEGLGNILIGRLNTSRNTAVLARTPAYKIPDTRGAVNVRFDEGQPVTVSDFHLDWCYAETADGRFGWVPREAVITY